jgi:tetratricopeptide (TPR) repeat protein
MKPALGASSLVALISLLGLAALPCEASRRSASTAGSTTETDLPRAPSDSLLPWERVLEGDDLARVTELDSRMQELAEQARYAEAAALAETTYVIRSRVLGPDHWETIFDDRFVKYYRYAATLSPELQAELAYADSAMRMYNEDASRKPDMLERNRRMLEIRRRILGDEHYLTLAAMRMYGWVLWLWGRAPEDEAHVREALAGLRRLEGEGGYLVVWAKQTLCQILMWQGKLAESERLAREAVEGMHHLRGPHHWETHYMMGFLALVLMEQGRVAEAEPLVLRELEGFRRRFGDYHYMIRAPMQDMGDLLYYQGRFPEAEDLLSEAGEIYRSVFGDHDLYMYYYSWYLGRAIAAQGRLSEAESLYRKALGGIREIMGEGNQKTQRVMSSLADLLIDLGRFAEAESLLHEATRGYERLGMRDCRLSLHTVARLGRLRGAQGRENDAQTIYTELLDRNRRVLGDDHQDVIETLDALAFLKASRGEYAEAERLWTEASERFETVRLRTSVGGLDRVQYAARQSPLAPLTACLAHNDKPFPAWESLEANLARGLLDAISARSVRPLTRDEHERETELIARLNSIDERISTLVSAREESEETAQTYRELRNEREALQAELAELESSVTAKYDVTAGESYELSRIQAQLPGDAAFVAWVDVEHPRLKGRFEEHWACVVRHEGQPIWVELRGSGSDGTWTEADNELPNRVREALGNWAVEAGAPASQEILEQLHAQRLAPVEPHLAGVERLVVLPAGWMAGIPVETLTDDYAVSYAPSATMYAWLKEGRKSQVPGHRFQEEMPRPPSSDEEAWRPLLALGDPVFGEPVEPDITLPEPPDHGVLLAMVMDGSNAARGGLRPGDVLLSYRGEQLGAPEDLDPAIEQVAEAVEDSSRSVPVRVWREGEIVDVTVAVGDLGVSPSPQPVPQAVGAKRRLDSALERTRGRTFEPLPASRLEVEAIAGLFSADPDEAAPTLLLGAEASERRLDELAASGDLGQYRHIHLATHALMDDQVAMRSALILSQERQDDALERVLEGKEVYDGRLTAEQIVRTWKLNADLVTLSGCETALGKASGGEGFLGFSQALFVAGARSLVLSLWEVEDTPTMLLMRRFYENLLGRFHEPRRVSGQVYEPGSPLPKVYALREAKIWLRELTWDALMELEGGGDADAPSSVAEMMVAAAGSDRLYEHPHYWAAFILMGDPD